MIMYCACLFATSTMCPLQRSHLLKQMLNPHGTSQEAHTDLPVGCSDVLDDMIHIMFDLDGSAT